jgi:hypothetical protein
MAPTTKPPVPSTDGTLYLVTPTKVQPTHQDPQKAILEAEKWARPGRPVSVYRAEPGGFVHLCTVHR